MNTTLSYALDDILTYKLDIKAAINAKGGDAGDTLSYYATAISNLPTAAGKYVLPDGFKMTSNTGNNVVDWSTIDTSYVTDMAGFFRGTTNTNAFTNLSYFDTSRAKSMNDMFTDCTTLSSLDLSHFNYTAELEIMQHMFARCTNLTYLNLSNIKFTRNFSSFGTAGMFGWCNNLSYVTLDNISDITFNRLTKGTNSDYIPTRATIYRDSVTYVYNSSNAAWEVYEPEPTIPNNTFYGALTSEAHDITIGGNPFTLDSYVTATNNDNLKLRTKNMTWDGEKYKFVPGNDNIQYYKLDDGKVFESLRFVELTPEYAQAFMQLGRLDQGAFTQDGNDLIFTVDNGLNKEDLYMNFTDVMNKVGVDMTCKMITVTEKERSN